MKKQIVIAALVLVLGVGLASAGPAEFAKGNFFLTLRSVLHLGEAESSPSASTPNTPSRKISASAARLCIKAGPKHWGP